MIAANKNVQVTNNNVEKMLYGSIYGKKSN